MKSQGLRMSTCQSPLAVDSDDKELGAGVEETMNKETNGRKRPRSTGREFARQLSRRSTLSALSVGCYPTSRPPRLLMNDMINWLHTFHRSFGFTQEDLIVNVLVKDMYRFVSLCQGWADFGGPIEDLGLPG
ncbi:hypothetical protein V3C99_004599 [Haemonchus contortus]